VSAATCHALALRAEAPASHLEPGNGLAAPGDGVDFEQRDRGNVRLARTFDLDNGAGITVAARDWQGTSGRRRVIERLAAWTTSNSSGPACDDPLDHLTDVERAGVDRVIAEHRQAWARRWQDAEVTIEGDAEGQLAARFAVFHLLAAAADDGEAAVGARGLTGPAYGGHVFWDADVFVLPVLAAIRPNAARAMLDYRIRRLPAARAAANAAGRRGARFPWESAGDGSDVTPHYGRGRRGELVPIHTGQHEVHIVADVAWAATEYAAWTGDDAFLAAAGRDLVVDTARYWASRAQHDADGRAHLYGVMGPDEYHEVVDDNAFTNVMARWNLQRAADLVEGTGGDGIEAAAWRALGAALVDGYDAGSGLYEQFAGYWGLEPLLIEDVAPPPVAADVLLGAERVAGSQLIKQADVVMLHHLIPDAVAPGSLGPNLAYYQARTAHGSSLSPAIHAALLARARQPDAALELFRLAARLDLDDLTGTTAGGLHLATMGGVWQALAYGFLGLRPRPPLLDIDPCLPSAWHGLGLRLRFRGARVDVRADRDSVAVTCSQPLIVRVAGGDPRRCDPPGARFRVPGGMP
jgi:trehalose/maltose hydrolase-like predicted phosphorylase